MVQQKIFVVQSNLLKEVNIDRDLKEDEVLVYKDGEWVLDVVEHKEGSLALDPDHLMAMSEKLGEMANQLDETVAYLDTILNSEDTAEDTNTEGKARVR